MEQTKDLFDAIKDGDYSKAKESLHSAVETIITDKIEAKKEEVRNSISTDSDE